ncbi:MAG: hypothetical protein LM582_07235 [Desulfurococcaceae archaeon]|nr:hypothetical protein [Desulfurococcaceae archaeon]MCC6057631.1 hypothetical protein [Desulfurococcaceae archaeon]
MTQQISGVSDDEKIWALLAWLLSIIGAILVLVLKPTYRYAKYWAYLSLSFFIVAIIVGVVNSILALIPIVGWVISILISLAIVILWIIGIVRVLQITWWKPPLIYDIAKAIGIEKI